jgi:hypothetical protein
LSTVDFGGLRELVVAVVVDGEEGSVLIFLLGMDVAGDCSRFTLFLDVLGSTLTACLEGLPCSALTCAFLELRLSGVVAVAAMITGLDELNKCSTVRALGKTRLCIKINVYG